MRYVAAPDLSAGAAELCSAFGIGRLPALALAARGLPPSQLAALLRPSPFGPPGADLLLARAVLARHRQGRVVLYGDYDADGVCGTSLLWHALALAGFADVHCFLPHRIRDGYGLRRHALERLLPLRPTLLVSIDCGIASPSEIDFLASRGVECLVIDHHLPGARLPSCPIVHPSLGGWGGAPCAAGVALRLAETLLGDAPAPLRALAALATVADVVELSGPNRVLVRDSLPLFPTRNPGLAALCGISGASCFDSQALGFRLAPRVNAAGRLGCATAALELFTTAAPARARQLAAHLDALNKERKALVSAVHAGASRHVTSPHAPLACADPSWHPGVVGVAAGKLAESLGVPVAVGHVRGDVVTGSVRSPTLDVHELLGSCAEHLSSFGGHARAGGFTTRPGAFAAFARAFMSFPCPAPEPAPLPLLPLSCFDRDSVAALDALEPTGAGCPPALFLSRAVLCEQPRFMGADQSHLSLTVSAGACRLRAVAFGMAARSGELRAGRAYLLAFRPFLNTWNNRTSVELEVKDFAPAEG